MKYASIGSVSHGTLRTYDLLSTFASELAKHTKANFGVLMPRTVFDYAVRIGAAESQTEETVEADDQYAAEWLLEELQMALGHFAPPYCYFGAHEGDGSDFGFWPSMEAVNELPKVSDPSEVEAMGEDCVFVNDHGNVTVYNADGTVAWDCV